MKKNILNKPQAEKRILSPLHQVQTTPLSPISSEVTSDPGKSLAKGRLNAPIPAPRTARNLSPISSDSEPESQGQSKSQPPKSPRMVKRGLESRIKKFEKRRESESSMSEDSIPASHKSERLSKQISSPDVHTDSHVKVHGKSYSVDEVSEDRRRGEVPTPPPRPHRAEMNRLHVPVIPKITEDLLADDSPSSGPNRPARPRVSEIRRAKDKSRSTSPYRLDGEGDTDASSVFSMSSKSSSEVSSKAHHRKVHKKLSTVDTPSASLLPPPVPRRKSTSDADIDEACAPPLSAPPQRLPTDTSQAANPLSQQMADTLIKYILASEDPGLKDALRQIITSNPQAMKVIQGDTGVQGGRPPTPPQRPY